MSDVRGRHEIMSDLVTCRKALYDILNETGISPNLIRGHPVWLTGLVATCHQIAGAALDATGAKTSRVPQDNATGQMNINPLEP